MAKERVDPVKRITDYHLGIAEKIEGLPLLEINLTLQEYERRVINIENFYKENISDHFQLEEELVFPAVKAAVLSRNISVIMQSLSKDHDAVLQELGNLQNVIYSNVFPLGKNEINLFNATVSKIRILLKEHVKKEDECFIRRVKDELIFLNPDMMVDSEMHFGIDLICNNVGPVSVDLHEAMGLVKILISCKIMAARFYRELAQHFKEEAVFMLDLAKEKIRHVNYMRKMVYGMAREPGEFSAVKTEPHDFRAFLEETGNYITKIRAGRVLFENLLFIAKDMEQYLNSINMEKIVETKNSKYIFFSSEVMLDTSRAREKIDRKIHEVRKSLA